MSLLVNDVINAAMRLIGNLSPDGTLPASDAASALVAFNRLKRSMFGTVIGPRLSSYALTGVSGQAENGGEYQIPTGAAFTLTAPTGPRSGARFGAVDPNLTFNTYNLTIARNGQLLNGAAANYVVATAGQATHWWFRGDTGSWVLETDWTALTNVIEFPDPLIDYLPDMLAVVLAAEYGADIRQDIIAQASEGRQAFARQYGRRGAASLDPPFGVADGGQQPQGVR